MIPPVSEAEIKPILDFLRLKNRDRIFEDKVNSPFYILQMLNLFPDMEDSIFDAFPKNKIHFELKTMDKGCVLLGPEGCVLPRQIRPHFCRIYPFWFFEDEPHIFQDSDCLALQTCHTIAEVLLCLGTNPEKLKQIHSRICQDWGLCLSMSQVKINIPL
jgi:Fe-S-cluster containining protein